MGEVSAFRDMDGDGSTAQCPYCGGESSVVDSRRHTVYGPAMVRRRRSCGTCGWRVSTTEVQTGVLEALFRDAMPMDVPGALRALADQIDEQLTNNQQPTTAKHHEE